MNALKPRHGWMEPFGFFHQEISFAKSRNILCKVTKYPLQSHEKRRGISHFGQWWRGAGTRKAGVVSSSPEGVTITTPLVRKATGSHLIKSNSLEKLRALSLVSATLEVEYATQ